MEIINSIKKDRPALKVALLDFDGTISTMRHGWQDIMEPMMVEMICGDMGPDDEIVREVHEYVNESVGIQTIFQMRWLAETVKKYGRNKNVQDDPWWYKAEYNRRLMIPVSERKGSVASGEKKNVAFLMAGSIEFLTALKDKGIQIYVASGTDHPDVVKEAKTLGVAKYFTEIAGAPVGRADCSKEKVLRDLIHDKKLKGQEVVVIGDGKVEIALAKEVGALALGIASDEDNLRGVDEEKRERLIKAGADSIIGDFEDLGGIMEWLNL